MPLTERKERLRKMLSLKGPHDGHIRYVEHLSEPGDAVLKSACNLNLEGIISKRAGAPYKSGRSETWHKSKCRGGQEVVIGGWSGNSNNLRSLLVGVYRGDHFVAYGPRRHGLQPAQRGHAAQEAERPKDRSQSLWRKRRAAQRQGLDLGRTEVGRRDRVRRLDRRWQRAAGCIQGPAGGQAGGGRSEQSTLRQRTRRTCRHPRRTRAATASRAAATL
jgi:ATP-dependent DNA ligase